MHSHVLICRGNNSVAEAENRSQLHSNQSVKTARRKRFNPAPTELVFSASPRANTNGQRRARCLAGMHLADVPANSSPILTGRPRENERNEKDRVLVCQDFSC